MEDIFSKISKSVPAPDNEYVGEDGLMHCSVCNKPTQTKVKNPLLEKYMIVRCICDCKKQELEYQKEREVTEERERRRRICFKDANMHNWNFRNDDRRNEKLSSAMQNYTKLFKDFKKDGKGLLLLGNVGTGKTYYAACIANELIDKGYSVKVTNLTALANQLSDVREGKQGFLKSLNQFDLIVFDDLGIERATSYMHELVYSIIDGRYVSGLPMIVTTNLSWEQLTKASEIEYQRIFDRVLEKCHPVQVNGQSRRKAEVVNSIKEINERLGL